MVCIIPRKRYSTSWPYEFRHVERMGQPADWVSVEHCWVEVGYSLTQPQHGIYFCIKRCFYEFSLIFR
jgi:hypothetical protein